MAAYIHFEVAECMNLVVYDDVCCVVQLACVLHVDSAVLPRTEEPEHVFKLVLSQKTLMVTYFIPWCHDYDPNSEPFSAGSDVFPMTNLFNCFLNFRHTDKYCIVFHHWLAASSYNCVP